MLVLAEERYPCQLRADFQQFYGLNIDDMGQGYSYEHAAVLVRQLPTSSRIAKAESPEAEWSEEMYMLSAIEYYLRILLWRDTKAAKSGSNKPKPNETPRERAQRERKGAPNKAFVDKILGVQNG